MEQKVLVVDDEAPIRKILVKALERSGFSVTAVGTAEEGLEEATRHSAPVAFLDLMLPGMDGVELCRKIKADNPIACIFAMTGHSSLFELADCREAGFDDYFRKPFSLEDMIEAARYAFKRITRWRSAK